jgi:hypothetical protein
MVELARVFADPSRPRESRLQAAAELSAAVIRYGQSISTAARPKLPALLELIGICRPVFDQEGDELVHATTARVLGHLYRQTHAIYRPDDNARDRTMRLYREGHPAAAAAAEAIVIYPLNRKGAPGL